jgi:hypothetical protein
VPHVYRRSLPVDVGPLILPTSETPSSNRFAPTGSHLRPGICVTCQVDERLMSGPHGG